jgi:large subunit ribosomal protein L31
MRDGIHPKYQPVVFKDVSSGFTILTRSTIRTGTQKITWEDGKEYPVVTVDVSSASHPFYTGKSKFMDTAGRVDRFNKKFQGTYGKGKKKGEGAADAAAESKEG